MKRLLLSLLFPLALMGQPLPPPTTTFTRGMLVQPDAVSVRSYIGASAGGTNATYANGIQVTPLNLHSQTNSIFLVQSSNVWVVVTNLVDAQVAVNAAIARSKLASGGANEVVFNDGSGVFSSSPNFLYPASTHRLILQGGDGIGWVAIDTDSDDNIVEFVSTNGAANVHVGFENGQSNNFSIFSSQSMRLDASSLTLGARFRDVQVTNAFTAYSAQITNLNPGAASWALGVTANGTLTTNTVPGGGSGTVTSVNVTSSPDFVSAGGPVTTSGTITLTPTNMARLNGTNTFTGTNNFTAPTITVNQTVNGSVVATNEMRANTMTSSNGVFILGSGSGTNQIGTTGVLQRDDGDGGLITEGLGNGNDENVKVDYDNTANQVVHTSTSGVTNFAYTGIGLTSPGFTGALIGNADTATTATNLVVADTTSATAFFMFSEATSGPQPGKTDGGATYNATTGIAGFTGLNLGTDGSLRFDEHASAPGTPAAGNVVIYAKADGFMYGKDDAGVETLLSNGAGGGEVNTASNLGTGWPTFDNKSGVDLRFNTFTNDATLTSSSNANTFTWARAPLTGDATAGAGANAVVLQGASSDFQWNHISPSMTGTNQDNFNPTGFGTAVVVRMDCDVDTAISGMVGQDDNETKMLVNIDGSGNVMTILDEHASSTDTNRFNLTGNIVLAAGDGASFIYDGVANRWICVGLYRGATAATVSNDAFASGWNGVTTTAPSQNAVYDWGHIFDTDDDGKPNVLDQVSGIANTDGSGVLQTPITTHAGLVAVVGDLNTATRTATGLTFDAAATGNVLTFTDYKDFVGPWFADGTGATILTNSYANPLWGLLSFSGSAETNGNYGFMRMGKVPYDLNTGVELVLKGLAIRVSGTDADVVTLDIGLFNPAESAGHAPTAWSSFSTYIRASETPSSVSPEDIFYFSDITLTGWAAAVTTGRTWIIGIARLNTANDDVVTVVDGTIEYTRTK